MLFKKYINQRLLSAAILLVAFMIFLLINIFTSNYLTPWRLDLTQNKMYTLSVGTKEIIAAIDEPLTFDFYFSKKLAQDNPFLKSFGHRVEDLLVQYAKASKGKIILRVKQPMPFTELEDEAVSYGLRGLPNGQGAELFFGIVVSNTLNEQQTIPLLRPEREENLEYDLSQIVYSLSQEKLPTIGVLSTLPLAGNSDMRVIANNSPPRSKAWMILEQIQQSFNFEMLNTDLEVIPASIDTLMLVNPLALKKATLLAIDNFVINGGHVLAFLDPYSESTNPVLRHTQAEDLEAGANLAELLAAWGIALEPGVVAIAKNGKLVRLSNDNHEAPVRYALWVDLDKKNFEKSDILTNSLERITLATPGAIKVLDNSQITVSPLITTEDAMLVAVADIEKYQKDPRQLLLDYQPSGNYTLAARISGSITSPYSGKNIAHSNIVVIADADMLHDHFWINFQNIFGERVAVPSSSNGNFVISALENLSGSDALISIRNRAPFSKPFTKINQLANKAEQEFKDKESLLVLKLEETKQKLQMYENKLQDTGIANALENKQAHDLFKAEFLNVRKELREVRHRLSQNIEKLELNVKFLSIGLMPIIVTMFGVGVWLLQAKKQRRLS